MPTMPARGIGCMVVRGRTAGRRFTAADISIGYTLGLAGFTADIALPPKLQAYHDRLKAQPACQRAVNCQA